MFLLDPQGAPVRGGDTSLVDESGLTVHWSASDLTLAAECEYSLLRTLDYHLKRADRLAIPYDPLLRRIAYLGDLHEAELLAEMRSMGRVAEITRVPPPFSRETLLAAAAQTSVAFASMPDVVFQAAFFDGEFFGYADFIERASDGWLVCDAKLARHAKPKALIQLGAYAEQLIAIGQPLSATVSLLLGDGQRVDFPVSDVLPAFRERRSRLRELIGAHRESGGPIQWGAPGVLSCGRCEECTHAAETHNDVLLVAGARMDQRRRLREAGIHTLAELACAGDVQRPADMAPGTFEKLRAQAALQWQHRQADPAAPPRYEFTAMAPETLALLPAPSPGDLFFDFEGDPMHHEGDRSQHGLEYLWGIMSTNGYYHALWAHDGQEEREAFIAFMEFVTDRLREFPDLHIYHYAPYETTALKRLAVRYQVMEDALDDLLRAEVFVDLFATVKGSLRVSSPSYSIKKLEPFYMGSDLRSDSLDAVGDGGASVVAYHEYCALNLVDPAAAAERLMALADYNRYDCLSTLKLRDWLLERADEAGVRALIEPRIGARHQGTTGSSADSREDPLVRGLLELADPIQGGQRTDEDQGLAMLATAIDYHRREHKTFWWEHYDRLQSPIEEWAEARDVFVVESAEVEHEWAVPEGRARNSRRVLRLVGDWAAGSKESSKAFVVYASPYPDHASGPDGALYAGVEVDGVEFDPDDHRVVRLTETRPPGQEFDHVPVALAPASPPHAGVIATAIRSVAQQAANSGHLPRTPAMDILARRTPRLRSGAALPVDGQTVQSDLVAALLAMDDSYVAVQGPPGTGKTYVGSRVIRELVEKHHWRIGVVAQSHAVVENMLSAIVNDAGLDPTLVGKSRNDTAHPPWTKLADNVSKRHAFLADHKATGCVIGGTAWTFSHPDLVGDEPLDLLVIDEAGQFALAPTIGAATSAKRLLLLGDPQQLPQVSQGTHAEPVDESALGWLMGDNDTLPAQMGYFLAATHRLHPELCARVSLLSYDGRLVPDDDAALRHLEGVLPGVRVVTVNHAGNRVESPEEAEAVVAVVRDYLGRMWTDGSDGSTPRPLTPADFLVVAPYNAQVALIRRALIAADLGDVPVGTVDKFQGQEAPIAIVSMTASSHGDVPRGMGFLLNRNRINVAISRAKWQAVIIRSAALTSYMPATADGVLELGAFVGLCS